MSKKSKSRTVQQMAANWAANYGASGAAMAKGVAQPSRDPTQAAIAQQSTMVSNWNAAVSSGQWASALAASGLAGWQAGMTQKTIPQLAQRAQVGQSHVAAFLNSWIPAVNQEVSSLPARGTYATNKQRLNTLLDWMHGQRGRYKHVWRSGAGGIPYSPAYSSGGAMA